MSDINDTEETTDQKKFTPTTIVIAAVTALVLVVGGVYIYKLLSRGKIDSLVYALTSPDIAEIKAARAELGEKSEKDRQVAEVLWENLAVVSGDDLNKEDTYMSVLIGIGDDNVVSVVSEGLENPETDEPTRKAAIKVLSQIQKPAAAEALVKLLGNEKEGKAAMEGLIIIGSEGTKALTKALESKDAEVRRKAVVILGRIGDPAAMKPLGKALKDEDMQVRLAAVLAVATVKGEGVIELLTETLKDPEADVRKDAIDKLENIVDASAIDAIIGAMKDEDPRVRAKAAKILGNLGDPKAIDPLLAALAETDVTALQDAIDAIGKYREPRASEALIGLLGHTDPNVRRKSITALGGLGNADALEPILACEDSMTKEAVVAYGKFKDARATEKLIETLIKEITFKEIAMTSLGQINDPRTMELAVPALKDSTFTLRIKKELYFKLEETVTEQSWVLEEGVVLNEILATEIVEEEEEAVPPTP